MYSNPPVHGARIVAQVVNDEGMFGEWKAEMQMMSGRIKSVRQLLFDELNALNPDKDWGFVLRQIGMFSFTGALHYSCCHAVSAVLVALFGDVPCSIVSHTSASPSMYVALMSLDDCCRHDDSAGGEHDE